jgi:hypothetical protein
MVLTVSFVLLGDEFLFVTVAERIDATSPGWAGFASLTAATDARTTRLEV